MKCSFCGKEITAGCGKLYVRKDGSTELFCATKCERNLLKLKRDRRKTKWTSKYTKSKASTAKSKEKKEKEGKSLPKAKAKGGKKK